MAASAVTGGALVVAAALVSVIGFVLMNGWKPVSHMNFWTHDRAGVGPRDSFDKGGILHAIVGSLVELGIAWRSRCHWASARQCS